MPENNVTAIRTPYSLQIFYASLLISHTIIKHDSKLVVRLGHPQIKYRISSCLPPFFWCSRLRERPFFISATTLDFVGKFKKTLLNSSAQITQDEGIWSKSITPEISLPKDNRHVFRACF